MTELNAFISNGTCYHASGKKVDEWLPCGNTAFGQFTCCQRSDMCLSSRACYNARFGVTYLGGCSDPEYKDASCPDKGALSSQPWAGLVYCNGTSEQWVACEQKARPTTLTSADACWCPQTSRTVAFTDSSILENVVQLPTALGGSVIWQPGHVPLPTQPNTTPTGTNIQTTASITSTSSSSHPTATNTNEEDDGTTMTAGSKVGIGVGVGLGCTVLLAVLIYLFFARRKWQRGDMAELDNTKSEGGNGWGRSPATPAGTAVSELESTTTHQWSDRMELDATPRGSTVDGLDGFGSKDQDYGHGGFVGKSLSVKHSGKGKRSPSPIAELPG
ncbi:hypothetical protein CGCF415_v004767 [Colletotrichum fructicola]|nr:hypothetical protein CGCF415_v004767 [Colletotrichum fructicola]KAF4936802.1 hypothetical protein CGCF245_v006155 [Colletotrichum fructicola]